MDNLDKIETYNMMKIDIKIRLDETRSNKLMR